MNKKTYFFSILFLIFFISCNHSQDPGKTSGKENGDYNPRYWLEGVYDDDHSGISTDAEMTKLIDDVYSKGWRGVLYWGASRDGAKMNYYYKSPFLEKQSWAVFKGDGFSSAC